MVRGKPSSWSDRGVDITSHSLRNRFLIMFMLINTTGTGRKMVPCSQGEWPYPQAGMKGKWLFGNYLTVFQTCVLGLPGQVYEFDSNHPLLTVWDCLIPLPHRVIRVTSLYQSWCLTKVLPWLSRVSCLHRMDNQLEYWKLKCEIKDLLFIAFKQKKNQSLQNPA